LKNENKLNFYFSFGKNEMGLNNVFDENLQKKSFFWFFLMDFSTLLKTQKSSIGIIKLD
jgi:hypothetical protein